MNLSFKEWGKPMRWALGLLLAASLLMPASQAQAAWWSEDLKLISDISNLPGNAEKVDLGKDRVYLTSWIAETNVRVVSVIDVDDHRKPKLLTTWQSETSYVNDIGVSGDKMVTSEYSQTYETTYGVRSSYFVNIRNMKNPEAPQIVGTFISHEPIYKIKVADSKVFVVGYADLKILDLQANLLGTIFFDLFPDYDHADHYQETTNDIAINGDRVFQLTQLKMRVLNIRDPKNAYLEKVIYYSAAVNDNDSFGHKRIAVSGDKAFVAIPPNVVVYNWKLAPEAAEMTSYNTMMHNLPANIVAEDKTLYIPLGREGVQAIDVSNVYSNDFMKGYYLTPGEAIAVAVDGDYVYVATGKRGLTVLKLKD